METPHGGRDHDREALIGIPIGVALILLGLVLLLSGVVLVGMYLMLKSALPEHSGDDSSS